MFNLMYLLMLSFSIAAPTELPFDPPSLVSIRAHRSCVGTMYSSGWVLAPRMALPLLTNPSETMVQNTAVSSIMFLRSEGAPQVRSMDDLIRAAQQQRSRSAQAKTRDVLLLAPRALMPGVVPVEVSSVRGSDPPVSGDVVCVGDIGGATTRFVAHVVDSVDELVWLKAPTRVRDFCGSCFVAGSRAPLGVSVGAKGRKLVVERVQPARSVLGDDPPSKPDDPFDGYMPTPTSYAYSMAYVFPDRAVTSSSEETFEVLDVDERGNTRLRVERRTGDSSQTEIMSFGPDGLRQVSPDQVLFLPAHPRAGVSWDDRPVRDGVEQERSCTILVDQQFCLRGVAVACWEKSPINAVSYTRDSFCPGEGWKANESALFEPDHEPMWRLTMSMSRDGKRVVHYRRVVDHPLPSEPNGPLDWTLRGAAGSMKAAASE